MMSRSKWGQLAIVVSGLLTLIVGLWAIDFAAAQTGGDGRINVIAPLGGATIYCVDAQRNPASTWAGGGIRVLDIDGSEVLYLPAASIPEPGAEPILLAEGQGRYSLLTLYRLPSGEFQLNGADEHGHPFEFRWTDCVQRGAAVATSPSRAVITEPPGDPIATSSPTPTLAPTPTRDVAALCAGCQAQEWIMPGVGCFLCVRWNNIADVCTCPQVPPLVPPTPG